MKRVLFVWMLCLTASAGSFGVLLAEDRTLGLPLPYTIPLAFVGMLIAGPILQMLAAKLWPQPTIVMRQEPAVTPAKAASPEDPQPAPAAPPAAGRATPRPRATAQGVVLFDLSRIPNRRHAA